MGNKNKQSKTTKSTEELPTESEAVGDVKNEKNIKQKKNKKKARKKKHRGTSSVTSNLKNEEKVIIKEEIKVEVDNPDVNMEVAINLDPKKNKSVKRSARIIIRNMSFKATDETLKEHFVRFGEVLEVKILRKPGGKLVGCAFVQFRNVPMAKKAILETNMKPFLGRPISVDWAVPKDKYMKHILESAIDNEPSGDIIKNEIKSEEDCNDNKSSLLDVKVKKEPIGDDNDDTKSGSEDDSEDDDDSDDQDHTDNEIDAQDHKNSLTHLKNENSDVKWKSNDAEDGCTVFVTNVPFSMDKAQLAGFASKIGPIKYAVICMDPLTEHSRGTGFVKFETNESASEFISLGREELTVDGQVLQPKPALLKEHLGDNKTKKQPKDNRNLYLVKEGVIIAGTKAAVGLSASDMAKRLSLEQSKTQMLRNLNRFVSRYRLVVQNLPLYYDDAKLRRLCAKSVPGRPFITEARVMRDLRSPIGTDRKHPSKGYGFVMFTRHEDALACLRKLNNNPEIFDKNNRPIVSFSIEDRAVLNARKKRLEKSQQKNPLSKQYQKPAAHKMDTNFQAYKKDQKNEKDFRNARKNKNLKRPLEDVQSIAEQPAKKKRLNKKKPRNPEMHNPVEPRMHSFKAQNLDEYSGLTSKPGSQHKMRSNFKLRKQAEIHRQSVKETKQKQKKSSKTQLLKNKEKIKQPKQKLFTNTSKKALKTFTAQKTDKNFSDLVSKYKSKLVPGKAEKVKAKWYES